MKLFSDSESETISNQLNGKKGSYLITFRNKHGPTKLKQLWTEMLEEIDEVVSCLSWWSSGGNLGLLECETCNGSGSAKYSKTVTCPMCKGSGEIRNVSQSLFGQFVNISTCQRCSGEGQIIENPCHTCNGEGRINGTKTIEVNIPAGVKTGNYIPLNGEGHAGLRNGPAGDLIVHIEEKPHKIFDRRGDDVVYTPAR